MLKVPISVRPRPEAIVRPEIRARRPPDEYIDLLTKSESEFRRYVSEIESDPLFKKMLSNGYVRKVNFKGRIPTHIYQEFQDREFMELLKEYDITSQAGWESDFFDKKAMRRIGELSAKYKVPRGDLIKALEYCRHLKLSWDGKEEDIPAFFSFDEPDRFRQIEIPDMLSQSDESLTTLSTLLEQYSISEQEFLEYFLSGNPEPFEIARDLDIDVNAVGDIIDALEKVQIMSSMQVNVVERHDKSYNPEVRPIAIIRRLKDPPRAEIQIDVDEQYSNRYSIKRADENMSREELALIDKLKMINHRQTLTFRVVRFIYEFQYPYFVSMNELYLKPLNQAQIAKEMGEYEPTVSRILRNKYLETSEGILPLKFFCQSKRDVIRRIIQIRESAELSSGTRYEPFSDAEIADILEREYNTKVSRRTVTYYRNKIRELPKFYARKRVMSSQ